MRTFFELFAQAPFQPLTKHAEKVHEVVLQVPTLMEAMLNQDWVATEEMNKKISVLEHNADEIKQEIRDHLPKSLFLPVDRGDLLRFLTEQDAIADAAEDLAVLITMRQTTATEEMKPAVRALVAQIMVAEETWVQTARSLPDLQQASFSGPEVERILALIRKVSTAEWEADKLQAELGRQTMRDEEELGAVSVLIWMRIGSKLGDIANHAENSADLLRLMLAKS